jgi:hypothetical protein
MQRFIAISADIHRYGGIGYMYGSYQASARNYVGNAISVLAIHADS